MRDAPRPARDRLRRASPRRRAAWRMLFPGQGSQAPDMLGELAVAFAEVRGGFETIDAALQARGRPLVGPLVFPPPAFNDAERERQRTALAATEVAQPALGGASLGLLRLLGALGVVPEVVAGHSYGELVALCAAGALDAAALAELSEARGRFLCAAVAAGDEPGTMAALAAGPAQVDAVLERDRRRPPGELERPAADGHLGPARGGGAGARAGAPAGRPGPAPARGLRLPLAAGRRGAASRWPAWPRGLGLVPPRLPVYSNVTAAPYPADPAAIAAQMGEHLARPVRFAEMVEAMHARRGADLRRGRAGLDADLAGRPDPRRPAAPGGRLRPFGPARDRRLAPGPGAALRRRSAGSARAADAGRSVRLLDTDRFTGADDRSRSRRRPGSSTATAPGRRSARSGPGSAPARRSIRPRLRRTRRRPRQRQRNGNGNGWTDAPRDERQARRRRPACTRLVLGARAGGRAGRSGRRVPADDAEVPRGPADDDARPAGRRAIRRHRAAPAVAIGDSSPPQWAACERASEIGRRVPAVSRPSSPGFSTRRSRTVAPPPAKAVAARRDEPRRTAVAEVHDGAGVAARLLAIVRERTGYPAEMLGLDLDLEADLGIDSIKRVEILGSLRDGLPALASGPGAEVELMDQLSRARTLGEIVAKVERALGTPTAPPTARNRPPRRRSEARTRSRSEPRPKHAERKRLPCGGWSWRWSRHRWSRRPGRRA